MTGKQRTSALSKGTIALFVVAIALLLVAGGGSARAALTYFSETYTAQVALPDIGVTLQENGKDVSYRDYSGADDVWNQGSNTDAKTPTGALVANLVPKGEQLMPGRVYPEAISVKNSGTIDQYVRVKILRYWVDDNGKKTTALAPSLIHLNFLTGANGWIENPAERTTERSVFYYTKILPTGEVSPALTDTLSIDGSIVKAIDTKVEKKEGNYTTITSTYLYNGYKFMIEAEVDAVQTHNAHDAIMSAWSVDMSVAADGSLKMN